MKGEDENGTGESVPSRGTEYKVGEAAARSVGGERREETQEAEQRERSGERHRQPQQHPCGAKASAHHGQHTSLRGYLHRPFLS